MRALVQPRVLRQAGLAALITTAACWPRLALWTDRPRQLWFLTLTLLWAAFILWSFVFGWHQEFTGRPVLWVPATRATWGLATGCGLAGGLALQLFIDPTLRLYAPHEYPNSVKAWMAMTLFALAFDPLFLYFAPISFFARLFRHRKAAMWLTIVFGLFLLLLKLRPLGGQASTLFLAELFLWRLGAGYASVVFYLNGGATLTGWWIFLLQLRHLIWP